MEVPALNLAAGQDYPKDWNQFLDWFGTEAGCRNYLERLRWPQGHVCPRCGSKQAPCRASRERFVCRPCRRQYTLTAGTLFDKTRTPLRTWFAAVWYLTNQKQGVSALGLQRVLGLGSYQTAWTMLHRLRRAMVRKNRDRLKGTVEVDETYLGASSLKSCRKRDLPQTASMLAIAIEVLNPTGFGRVRIRRVARPSKRWMLRFVGEVVEPGTCVRTDESGIYYVLGTRGYIHEPFVQLRSSRAPHLTLPGVQRVASLLRRWLLGTHQGAIRTLQLDSYLEEFTFRFNRRTSLSRGLLF